MRIDPYYENLFHHYKVEVFAHWRGIIGLLLLALFVVNIQGCATLGYENVDTTRKAIVVANAEVRAANLLLQDLIRRDVITDADAQTALDSLRTAHGQLQTALDAVSLAGDAAAGRTGLDRANTALSIVITLLSTYTGTEGLFFSQLFVYSPIIMWILGSINRLKNSPSVPFCPASQADV